MASAAPLLRIETERPRRLRLADARGRLPHRVAIRSSTSPDVETAGRNLADPGRRRYFDDDARAFKPLHRSLVLVVASISKIVFIGLVLTIGNQYLAKAGVTIAIDSVVVIIFFIYLAQARNVA